MNGRERIEVAAEQLNSLHLPRSRNNTNQSWRNQGGNAFVRNSSRKRNNQQWRSQGNNPPGQSCNQHSEYRNSQLDRNQNRGDEKSRQQEPKRSRIYKMGFKVAQELAESEDVVMVVETLMNDRRGFKETLKDQLSGDLLVIIVQVLKNISQTAFISSKTNIFNMVFIDSTYTEQLRTFVLTLPDHQEEDKRRNKFFWKDTDQFWYNLIEIFDEVMKIPTLASQFLPKLLKSLIRTIPALEEEQLIRVSDEIIQKFKIIQSAVEKTKITMEAKYQPAQQFANRPESNEDILVPPNDFRTISIYPSIIEVTSRDQPFLRKNKIRGPYINVEHYLDVQFRLLREDFIEPLRDGICQYLEKPDQKRYDNIKIHKQVQFLNEENVNEMKCFRIKFHFSNKKISLKYENSKQFMYGSLVCFTKDGFLNLIFGKIVKRDVDMIKQGELIVGFDYDVDISYTEVYMMVESSVYFEPYYHVLTVLQGIQGDKFPLERYIIYAESRVDYPTFITPFTNYTIDSQLVYPMNWPNDRKFYSLNESQQKAFKAALTHQLSVIQGPPGTGKTFLGLKIAKTLLHNHETWFRNSPILVICYTNHALDQFLEGIVQTTRQVVRVGSQSKNEKLNEFNLNKLKRGKKSGNYYQVLTEMKVLLCNLKSIDSNIAQLKKNNGIIQFSQFNAIPGFRNTWFSKASNEEIKNWLLQHVTERPIGLYEENIRRAEAPKLSHDSDTEDELSDYSDHEEEVDDLFTKILFKNHGYIISLKSLSSSIQDIEQMLANPRLFHQRDKMQRQLWQLTRQHDYLRQKLIQFAQSPGEWCNLSPEMMTENQRWGLYRHCCTQYLNDLTRKRIQAYADYQDKYKLYHDVRAMDDLKVLRENLVVGMTTTSAARLRASLEALKCPIVIVEEAAEVLEAHITSALTIKCKQLILIGDHQQLKPSTASYRVETKFKMGVSLFERMINNEIECHTLDIQHRMRPNICNLIRPAIYSDLKDHESVEDRPRIKGVEKYLFFLHHTHQEMLCGDTSKKNVHEATFLVKLAKYLILNGYNPKDITILAAYLGQMFEIQREKRKYSLIMRDVRISVLDNYQGEESDIILLSLVRNNKENNNGFLKIENRVCVALSRARNGLYIMGNMDQLCQDPGTVWLKIKERLEEQNSLGTHLELKCQIHHKITKVKNAEDFSLVSEGGCDVVCNAELACGHNCKNICHLEDRDHQNYDCLETCGRKLCDKYEHHLCTDHCFMKCRPCYYPVRYTLRCGHEVRLECHVDVRKYKCIEQVPTELPCRHQTDKPCHYAADEFPCPHPCDTRVEPCGHACMLNCHIREDPDHCMYKCKKPCAKIRKGCSTQGHLCRNLCYEECQPCTTIVRKKRTICSHQYDVACNSDVDAVKCEKPCTRKLECGHKCPSKCFEKCAPCKKKVDKIIPDCGHKVKIMCYEIPQRKHCNENCERALQCGHKCVKKCKDPCTSQCEEMKDCNLLSLCNHTVTRIKCYERLLSNDKSLLKYCTSPCTAILKCTHKCQGTCGGCFQGRIHMRCMEKCGVPLICNHLCPIPCREACKPCARRCMYKCTHSKCKKKCGDMCSKCEEECPRKCMHQTCKNKCGDICSVKPCKEPCPKKIECGHSCVGYCSEPCPRLCRICDEDELTEIFFGNEDEEDARFVELLDCQHVFESEGLETWLASDGEIQAKVCPRCKTSIVNTQRYSDYVKNALIDIHSVKIKLNGSVVENRLLRLALERRITQMKIQKLGATIYEAIASVSKRLSETRLVGSVMVRQNFNKIILNSLTMKIQILEHIVKICVPVSHSIPLVVLQQIHFILNCLTRDEEQITVQEIEDIQIENLRLKRLVEIAQICTSNESTALQTIREEVMTFGKYSELIDEGIKNKLKKLNCGIQISEKERIEIVRAIGLAKGHWYKCPNGHPYAVGECGGANQISKCFECGAGIGGTNHRFLSGNQVATEMDGARHSAWSEAANMQNYNF